MKKIADILNLDRVRYLANASSKKKALELIAETISNTSPLEARDIFDGLINRERLGSTGLGQGVAIPHTRMDGLSEPIGCFIMLKQGIDYNAEDNQAVDLLFALIVPNDAPDEYLQLLSNIAKLFSNKTFDQKIRQSASREELYQRIIHE